jgi:hypothetical protein
MNSPAHHEMIRLMVSWTLVGAIILTAFLTLLALAGFLAFSDREQRNKLLYILVAEFVVAALALFLGVFQLAPAAFVKAIEEPLKEASANIEQEKATLLAGQERLNAELAETKHLFAKSAEKADAYELQITKANANAEAQRETIAHLQDLAQRAATVPEQPAASTEEVNALKSEVAKAEMALAESRQVEETLTEKLKETKSKASALDQSRHEKERQIQRAKTIGRVLAINPGWNFVVVSIGDKQGATPDSTLLVLRGGAQIGKVRVKTIEPTQSIADVIPSSLRKGMSVQPGDNVVFEEIRNAAAPASQHSAPQGGPPIEPPLPLLPEVAR